MGQRRAARFVFNDYSRSSHVSVMINTLGWDSPEHRRLLNQVCLFYKIYKGLVGLGATAPCLLHINPYNSTMIIVTIAS